MCGGGESWGNDRGGVESFASGRVGRASAAGYGGGNPQGEGVGERRIGSIRHAKDAKGEKRGKVRM